MTQTHSRIFGFVYYGSIAVLSFVLLQSAPSYAHAAAETAIPVVFDAPESTESATGVVGDVDPSLEEEQYILPYPGILPDHPMYRVKLIRDKLLDLLIRDPLKRIEFNLLMADKRLNMGVHLVDKQSYELAEETISKGEKYFVKAVDGLHQLSDHGHEAPPEMLHKLHQAIDVHRETVESVKKKSPENIHVGLDGSLKIIMENSERIALYGK
jgi:hypothetical protein